VPAIEEHVLALARQLASGLTALGLPLIGPNASRHASHVLSVGAKTPDDTTQAQLAALGDHLKSNGVKLSIRHGRLRFSLHVYNAAEDVDRVLSLIADCPAAESLRAISARP
jgi:cysteine desulfurase / selenocysteine lyase